MDEIGAAHKRHDPYMDTKTIVGLYELGLQPTQAAKFGIRSIVYDMAHDPLAWKDGKEGDGVKIGLKTQS